MSGGAGLMAQGTAKVQQQQQQQEQKVDNPAAMARNKKEVVVGAKRSGAQLESLPEWKLNCLCSDYGIPPTIRRNLPMGSNF